MLVLNASGGAGRHVEDAEVERLRFVFDAPVAGSLACGSAVLPDLRETGGSVVFSGTIYTDPPVVEQLEWGAVGPAAHGLATTLDAALDDVQVTYVHISTAVRPPEESGVRSIGADLTAAEYRRLVEQDKVATRELDLRRRS